MARLADIGAYQAERRDLKFDTVFSDQKNEFFELHYTSLFLEAYTTATETFCTGDNGKRTYSPWVREFPNEFYNFVSLIAYPDPCTGKWDRLLRDEDERRYLVQAIIMMVLEAKVFSCLLFGADKGHMEILESEDSALIDAEGFRRSELRALTNRTYLSTLGPEPPRFWEEVDKIASGTVELLLPLYWYVEETQSMPEVTVRELYQPLHDIVAHAAWLSVQMRLSSSIFVTQWRRPGRKCEWQDEVNLSEAVYEHSKRMHGKRSMVKLEKVDTELPMPLEIKARVKISVAPEVKRFTPPAASRTQGVEVYTIMKPHAIYYHGDGNDTREEEKFVSLPTYVDQVRNARRPLPTIVVILGVFLWAFAIYGLVFFVFPVGRKMVIDLTGYDIGKLAFATSPPPKPTSLLETFYNVLNAHPFRTGTLAPGIYATGAVPVWLRT